VVKDVGLMNERFPGTEGVGGGGAQGRLLAAALRELAEARRSGGRVIEPVAE
jgi:hypothetical protein